MGMTENEQKIELEKCKNDIYYFFSNYILIDGKKPEISRDAFEEKIDLIKKYSNHFYL